MHDCGDDAVSAPGLPASLYPPGYRDPEYDGTVAGFCDVVLNARIAALTEGINDHYKDILPDGMQFEWVPLEGTAPGERETV